MGALADKIAGKTTMFGKTYNTVGSSDSNFIIKTKGDLKVLWGNKYIDIIKNGKISSEGSKLLFIVNAAEDIKNNGIYLVPNQDTYETWVCIDGIKLQISQGSLEVSYVSFLTPQEITTNLKQLALTNIGFYYPSMLDVQNALLNSGVVYVEETNALYLILNGILLEYLIDKTLKNTEEIKLDDIKIEGNSLLVNINGSTFVTMNQSDIIISRPIILSDLSTIKSSNYSELSGFELSSDKLIINDIDIRSILNSTIIGKLSEGSIAELQECPELEIVPDSGIYSSNFIGLNSKLYDTIFKIRCDYPKYDMNIPELELDSENYDQVVPNIKWIKSLIELIIPKGTIVMWSGTNIPKGWAICDGKNGTPNLIGKFIKADSTAGKTGGNNTVTLTEANLPDHLHTISENITEEAGSNKHTHTVSGQTVNTSETAITDSTFTWKTVPNSEDLNNLADITTVKGTNLKSLHEDDKYLDSTSSSSNHKHSVSTSLVTTSEVTEGNHTHDIPQLSTSDTPDAESKAFDIQPEYYSLIFIIKI